MHHRPLIAATAWAGALALALVAAPGAAVAAPAPAAASTAVPTSGDLHETGSDQQRWLSVPESRVVLNPYTTTGSELDGSAGNDLPLKTGFYAWDKAISVDDVLTTYVSPGESGPTVGWHADFSQTGQWTSSVGSIATDGTAATFTVSSGNWGEMHSEPITLDPSEYSVVKITVPSVSNKWALKVLPGTASSGSDLALPVAADTSATGELTFSLAATFADAGLTGPQTFRLRLFATNGSDSGRPSPSVTVSSLQIVRPDAGAFPDAGQLIAWSSDNPSSPPWTANRNTVALTNGVLALAGTSPDSYDFVKSPTISADLTKTPYLSVKTTATNGKWALKVTDGGADKTVQADTDGTGTVSFDLAAATGWSGQKSFAVKLFQIGKNTSTTFERLSVHSAPGVSGLTTASGVDYAWTPADLTMTGHYDAGTVTTHEFFDSERVDAFVRTIDAQLQARTVIAAGAFEGSGTSYDAATHTITIRGTDATRSIALPETATPVFYSSLLGLQSASGASAAPSGTTGYWAVELPGDAVSTIGVAWAVNAGSGFEADAPATSRADATAARSRQEASLAHWQQFWDGYMARVPAVEDFSIQRVADGGVTAQQMEHFYYKAWVGLQMNVLPKTPETGNQYTQVGTGKPSLWMHGTPGTRNVASWDSLLGMQQLVYTDPENSWQSFIGMMSSVSMTGAAPTDTNGVGTDSAPVIGALKGESLPSRKAQTAWILYSVTGDRGRLESIADSLYANLVWSSHNMRWIYGSNNYTDERDSEFVASLIYDLKFGVRVADLLGDTDKAQQFASMITSLTHDYEQWFFPQTTAPNGQSYETVQKVYLDHLQSGSGCPWSDASQADYYNEAGQCVKAGWSFYTTTALVADQLGEGYKSKVMQRFLRDYDPAQQLAGLGSLAVKAPDMQLITYGLLDEQGWTGHSRDDLRDAATVIVNSMNRDIVLSGWFAEVYQASGDHSAGGKPIASGVRPSLFGISNYIDGVWIANGYRFDEGTPTFVRLPGATGGVTGLTYLGKPLDVDIDGTGIVLTGDAANQPGVCDQINAPEGESITITTTCATVTASATTVQAGKQLTLHAAKLPASATATIELHSDPIVLADAVPTTATGTLDTTVTIPANTPTGPHTIVVTSGGTTGQIALTVTAADTTGGTGGNNTGGGNTGTSTAGTGTGASNTATLASTGADARAWGALAALGLLLAAGGMMLHRIGRSRKNRSRTEGV